MDHDPNAPEQELGENPEAVPPGGDELAANEGIPPSPTDEEPAEPDETAVDEDEVEPQPQVEGSPTPEDLGVDKGYIGDKVDPLPNEAHSLESGPDAPSATEQDAALRAARVEGDQAEPAPEVDED